MPASSPVFTPRLVTPTQTVESFRRQLRNPVPAKVSRSDSLSFWHRVTLASVRADGPDLSARQLAMMMTIYLETDRLHTVRSLAKHLGITKAAISRATDTLCKLDYIERKPDHRDKRSVVLTRTSEGQLFLAEFADIIQAERR